MNTARRLSIDWNDIRQSFPATAHTVYLNTAGGTAMSTRAAEAGKSYYDEMLAYGDTMWPTWLERSEGVRARLARFIGAEPSEVAFVANASQAMNLVAQLFDNENEVVLLNHDFPSVTLPWLNLGFPAHFVAPSVDGSVSLEEVQDSLPKGASYFATSHVQYNSGFRFDLNQLGDFCGENSLTLVLDATQSLGAYPIDVKKHGIDVLLFSGYKWSTAGYGIAGLYISKDVLDSTTRPAVGWRSAEVPYDMFYDRLDLSEEARAFELGHPPFPGIFALGGALSLLEEIGSEAIEQRICELTTYLHQALDSADIEIASPRAAEMRSGITMIAVEYPRATVESLKEKNIFVSSREDFLRVSLHFYNDESDVDCFVKELKAL